MTLTRRHLFRSFPLLLLALAATSAQAADNYLKVIPSTALAWGAVNHMNEASDKIQKLATIVQAPAAACWKRSRRNRACKRGSTKRERQASSWCPARPRKMPSVAAFFVAVADEKEFLGNFEIVKAGEKISEVKLKDQARSAARYQLQLLPCLPQRLRLDRGEKRSGGPGSGRRGQAGHLRRDGRAGTVAGRERRHRGRHCGRHQVCRQAGRRGTEESRKDERRQQRTGRGHAAVLPGSLRHSPGGRAQGNLAGRGRHPLRQAGLDPHHRPGTAGQRRPGVQGRRRNSARHGELALRRAGRSVRLRRAAASAFPSWPMAT